MNHKALDVGRSETKVFDGSVKYSFPSYCGVYRPLRLEREITEHDMIVEWNGGKWYVGEIARDESDDGIQNFLSSKVTMDTKLLGLVALHRIVKNGEEFELVTGHPIENHVPIEKEGMRNLFVGEHELTINGVYKRFTVTKGTVVPECAAAQFIIPQKHNVAHGVDVGGATTNFVTWEKGKWIDRLSGTLPFGLEKIRNMSIDQFARLIANGIAQRILQFRGSIYVMGGAAQPLAIALQKQIRNAPVIALEDGKFSNVRAYYEIGVKLREKLQTK
jgi:plasmid segregation protein ParM